MSRRGGYPFSSYGTKAYPAPTQKPKVKHTPVFSFYPSTYAIEINPEDESLKRGLRRKSFTGETSHPILRQLSDGRVNIPVEHIDEGGFSESGPVAEKPIYTAKTTKPECARSYNNARKQDEPPTKSSTQKKKSYDPRNELFRPLDENAENKSKEAKSFYGKPSYDPRKYEEQWALEKNPPSYGSLSPKSSQRQQSPLNDQLLDEIKNLGVEDKKKVDKQSEKASNQDEYDAEVTKQDKFMLDQYKLHRFHIIPDGNCLYRAVAQAVLLNQSQHMLLRQLAVEHIQENKEEFKDIIEGDIDDFLVSAKHEGEWAGYPEILALSRLLDININITTGGTSTNPNVHMILHYFEPREESDKKAKKSQKKEKFTQRQSIWLSWLSGGHYDTFTEKVMDNPDYDNWIHSRASRLQSDYAMANQMYIDDTKRQYKLGNANTDCDANNTSTKKTQPTNEYSTLPTPSYQNREALNIISGNINETMTSDDFLDVPLPSHEYPPPTYSEVSSSQNLEDEELDEALARSLQEFDNDIFQNYTTSFNFI